MEETIFKGWPKEKQEIPEEIAMSYKHWDEIAAEEVLISRGDRIIFPRGIRKDILNRPFIKDRILRARSLDENKETGQEDFYTLVPNHKPIPTIKES